MIKRLSAGGGVMIIAGTRPEMIKIAPVVRELARRGELPVSVVSTAQQADLLPAFLPLIGMTVNCQLDVMSPGQSLNSLLAKSIAALDPVIERDAPDLVVVQGDTISALAGALAASMRGIPVAHIEAVSLRLGRPRRDSICSKMRSYPVCSICQFPSRLR